jgi:hypothetical protein
MRFMRPLLGLKRLECRRNLDICNRLNVNNLTEDIKLYQKSWLDHLKGMIRSHLSKLALQFQSQGLDAGRPRKRRKDREHFEP